MATRASSVWRPGSVWTTLVLAAAGCADSHAPPHDAAAETTAPRWQCPAHWDLTPAGGCAPAPLACAPGACDAGAPDASAGTPALPAPGPDGGWTGPWTEPGAPGGPPRADWVPDAHRWDCPTGWTPGGEACDPALDSAACAEGGAPIPGGRCTATSTRECPADGRVDLRGVPAGARVLHVREGAPPGGDGSADRPLPSLADALAAAPDDGWIALDAGRYAAPPGEVSRPVHIVGACAARAVIDGAAAPSRAVLRVRGAALELRGVTLAHAEGLAVLAGARANLEAVRIDHSVRAALTTVGPVTARDLVIADVARHPAGQRGSGVAASGAAAELRLERFVVTRAHEAGIYATNGARVVLADGVVAATSADPVRSGAGLFTSSDATARADRVVFADNAPSGVYTGLGAHIELADVVVSGSRPLPGLVSGYGIFCAAGGGVHAERVALVRNAAGGAAATAPDCAVELDHALVTDTVDPPRSSVGATGLFANDGARVTARHTRFARNAFTAVAAEPGSTIELEHCVARDSSSPGGATALVARGGGALTARRVLLERVRHGAQAFGAGSAVEVTDSIVRPGASGTSDMAIGLWAVDGGVLRGARTLVEDPQGAAAAATGAGSDVDLEACVLRDVTPARRQGTGAGVTAGAGGVLRARRTVLEDVRGMGLQARDPGTVVELVDSVVRQIEPAPPASAGVGLIVIDGAELRMERSLVHRTHGTGAQFAGEQTRVALSGMTIADVAQSPLGFGVGVAVLRGARLDAERLAVLRVNGYAVAALSSEPDAADPVGAFVHLRDLYAHDVAPATIRYRVNSENTAEPDGRAVAYGLHVGAGCTLEVERGVVDGCEHGFVASAGTLRWRAGLVRAARRAFGVANAVPPERLVLDGVVAGDAVAGGLLRDVDLPSSAALPLPPPLCEQGCGR